MAVGFVFWEGKPTAYSAISLAAVVACSGENGRSSAVRRSEGSVQLRIGDVFKSIHYSNIKKSFQRGWGVAAQIKLDEASTFLSRLGCPHRATQLAPVPHAMTRARSPLPFHQRFSVAFPGWKLDSLDAVPSLSTTIGAAYCGYLELEAQNGLGRDEWGQRGTKLLLNQTELHKHPQTVLQYASRGLPVSPGTSLL